ncbi:hypothetical protein Rhe02_84390 [Rhizocola hellebori]|uniref:DUF3558 domain-containing protein n=1 Tax=Rhizocola hellebori TaxID=1392758 RepID=A0A8J3QIP8_9ACTN|nr:hypothetical protein [Rhizocola hellebori]GIH10372.1 hypothetical protein Rhe02_84390 [Rhizocola hellebori]
MTPFAALAVSAMLVAGCGSDQPETTPTAAAKPPVVGSAPDPCKLVTAAEVTAALGGATAAGVSSPGGLPGQRTCAFDAAAKGMATVGVAPGGAALFDQLKSQLGATAKPLAGVGDAAVRDAGQLTAVRGDWVVLIFVSGKNSDRYYETATAALAKAAVGRL